MPALKKLLLPVDYSDRSLTAAEHARFIAKQCGSQVTVLHVKEPRTDEDDGQAARRAAVANLLLKDLDVTSVELPGHPADVIVQYAREHSYDLIVMPTRGHSALRLFLLGSVTAKVLHDTETPVWTGVHCEQEVGAPLTEVRHVVCAVDLGPQSETVLRWAGDFAQRFGARLTVVHASAQLVPTFGVVHDPEFRAHLAELMSAQLADLLRKTVIAAETRLASGEPARAVVEVARESKSDVLVIGRTPPGLMGRLRATAYAIIRQSHCPVISV